MMKANKLLFFLAAAGILAATFFLFMHQGATEGDLGLGETQKIDQPEDLRGSLQAEGDKAGQESATEPLRGREGKAKIRGRSKAVAGGASLALRLYLDDRPLGGAILQLRKAGGGGNWKETTDRAGRARFLGLPPGNYVLLPKDQRVPKSYRIGPHRLKAGQAMDLGRVDVPPASALKFRLLRPDGRPLASTEVRLYPEGTFGFRGTGIEGQTDKMGRGAFFGLSGGEWTLSVAVPDLPLFERQLTLPKGENLDLGDLRLKAGFFLHGRVVDEQGAGISDVRLLLGQQRESLGMKIETFNERASARSDKSGGFRLVVGTKQGRIRARKKGFAVKTVPFQLEAGEVRIVLERSRGIRGRVLGAVAGKTEVFAQKMGKALSINGRWTKVPTDSKGFFSFPKLVPGTYVIMAVAEGKGASQRRSVKLGKNASAKVDLVIQKGGDLEVGVFTKSGKAIPGASLGLFYQSGEASTASKWPQEVLEQVITSSGGPQVRARSDARGAARFPGLWGGKALLKVEAKGYAKKLVHPLVLGPGLKRIRVELEGAARILGKALSVDGKALVGALVSLDKLRTPGPVGAQIQWGGLGAASQRTRSDGSFELNNVKPGSYLLSLKPPLDQSGAPVFDGSGPKLDQKTIQVGAGEELHFTLRAKPMWAVQGRVLFQGEPVAGASVQMERSDPPRGFSLPKTKKTDHRGNFRFDWVGNGLYSFRASPPEKGVRTPKKTLDLRTGSGLKTLDLELGGGLVRGRIAFEGERPKGLELILVPKAETKESSSRVVMVKMVSGNGEEQQQTMTMGDGPKPVVPKEDGSFEFHFVSPGDWILKIRAGKGNDKTLLKSLPLRLAKNQGLDLGDLSLEKTYPVQLLVKDPQGKGLDLALVKIYPLDKGKPSATPVFQGMIQKGKAQVPGLRVGSYKLVIRRLSLGAAKPSSPQEGTLEVLPGGKIRGGELRLR